MRVTLHVVHDAAGLAAAALINPAPVPEFARDSTACDRGKGEAAGPWRQLLRQRRQRRQRAAEVGARRRRHEVVERELSCSYAEAVRALLGASHGAAVLAAATSGDGKELVKDLIIEVVDGAFPSIAGAGASGFRGRFYIPISQLRPKVLPPSVTQPPSPLSHSISQPRPAHTC